MSQVPIYLEDETERKMIAAAKSARLSKSKWIAGVIEEKVANEWPHSVVDLAGSWEDFPSIDDIRSNAGKDAGREKM